MEKITKREDELKSKIDKIQEAVSLNDAEEAISDNKLYFELDGNFYRVRKATFGEKREMNKFRIKREFQLFSEKDSEGKLVNKTEKEIIEMYKNRGIDLTQYDEDVKNIQKEIGKVQMELGKELESENPADDILKAHEETINKYISDIRDLIIKKMSYFGSSIEAELRADTFSFLAMLTTDKKESEDKWTRVWNSFDDMLKEENEDLVTIATYKANIIADNINGRL